jgi:glycosyltransferase involved in cell wall biosynthesis
MNILIITQYFPPETGGPTNRLLSLALAMHQAGHSVEVITAKPNHPEGVIWPEYRGKLVQNRTYREIPVKYIWVYAHPRKTFFRRILNHISFMIMATLTALYSSASYDFVLVSSPPLFVGVAGWLVSRCKKARYIFDVRDLWPDLAMAVGQLQHPVMVSLARWLERWIYQRADAITAVTRSFCQEIQKRAPPSKPIEFVSNGTVPELFQNPAPNSVVRSKLGLKSDEYLVAYLGNVGICQGLQHLVACAQMLQERDETIRFLIMGDGPVKTQIMAEADQHAIRNMIFRPRLDLAETIPYMQAADALMVSLVAHELLAQFVPSKFYDSMACGKPILLGVQGEAKNILNEAGAGIDYPNENPSALAAAILWLKAHPAEAKLMGRQGQEYVAKHFRRADQAVKMMNLMERLSSVDHWRDTEC